MKNNTFGVDRFVEFFTHLRGARIGLITNDAARPADHPDLTSRLFLVQSGFNLVKLFSPEHGIAATADDGAAVADRTDPVTGLPVVSLYGERMRPRRADLEGLDLLLFDIPDVGARFYTYNWTMSHALEACAEAGLPFRILDRPNPVGGRLFEGPVQDAAAVDRGNFLGREAIPIRHGLTTGELARLLNRDWGLDADLDVITADGWKREMLHRTAFPFHQPSPALQTFDSVVLYPGLCLFEATNMSIGRGTDASFLQIGAPWLEPEKVMDAVPARLLSGVTMSPSRFSPSIKPWEGAECSGIRFNVVDAGAVRPVALALGLLAAIRIIHHNRFEWSTYPTAANPEGRDHFLRLTGSAALKDALVHHPQTVLSHPENFTSVADWEQRIHDILLYPAVPQP